MARFGLERLSGSNKGAKLTGISAQLRDAEVFFVERTKGVVFFFLEHVPEFFRALLTWLHASLLHSIHIAIRLVRVGVAISVWLLIVFGFFALYPGITSGLYTILALVGSIFGVRRRALKMRATATAVDGSPADGLKISITTK